MRSSQSPHSLNGEQTQVILHHLGTQKGTNLCLKCTKISLAAGFRPDQLGELKHSSRSLSHNQWGLILRGGSERKEEEEMKERRGGEKAEGGKEGTGKVARCFFSFAFLLLFRRIYMFVCFLFLATTSWRIKFI